MLWREGRCLEARIGVLLARQGKVHPVDFKGFQRDPTNGATLGLIDLSAMADPDGLPEMSMMAWDGRHLFVQLQRIE